jgi:hypothetical protein
VSERVRAKKNGGKRVKSVWLLCCCCVLPKQKKNQKCHIINAIGVLFYTSKMYQRSELKKCIFFKAQWNDRTSKKNYFFASFFFFPPSSLFFFFKLEIGSKIFTEIFPRQENKVQSRRNVIN